MENDVICHADGLTQSEPLWRTPWLKDGLGDVLAQQLDELAVPLLVDHHEPEADEASGQRRF